MTRSIRQEVVSRDTDSFEDVFVLKIKDVHIYKGISLGDRAAKDVVPYDPPTVSLEALHERIKELGEIIRDEHLWHPVHCVCINRGVIRDSEGKERRWLIDYDSSQYIPEIRARNVLGMLGDPVFEHYQFKNKLDGDQ